MITRVEEKKLFDLLKSLGFSNSDVRERLLKLEKYADHVIRWNKVHNLTGAKNLHEVYFHHLLDTFLLLIQESTLKIIRKAETIADLGAGAGFGGITLKILLPEKKISLIEPRKKRASFLRFVIADLELKEIEVLDKRAEEVKSSFEVVIARAFAEPLKTWLVAKEILADNGKLIIWISRKTYEEKAKNTIKKGMQDLKMSYCEVSFPETRRKTGFLVIEKAER